MDPSNHVETEDIQESLKASERLFRGLFEHSPVALVVEDFSGVAKCFSEFRRGGIDDLRAHLQAHPGAVMDLASRVKIQNANKAALQLFRASSSIELARSRTELLTEESLEAFQEELTVMYEGRTGFSSEAGLRNMKGGKFAVERRVSVQPGHEGDLGLVLVSLRDLTARNTAEAERQRLERELDHLRRLDGLGRLASGVSHDMNNVLCAIMAVSSILKDRHGDMPDIAKNAEMLLQAATRGRDLVKGLRDFSRKELESNSELDLNVLARHEASLLECTMFKKFAITLDLASALPLMQGNASAISNALMNICVNACDAMPHGGRLTLITRALGQGFVELAVKDDGEGMPPEVQARALEPFFTTKPVGKGTGLGLAQVYGTVKAHGGTMNIQSKPGKGTTVSLVFPSMAEPSRPASATPAAPDALIHKLDVLVVDDDEAMRSSLGPLLESLGHRPTVTNGGLEALQRLEGGLPADLVLLDVNMPELDGVETLARIWALRPKLPVLIITGYVDDRIPALLKRFPDLSLLPKPFGLSELKLSLSQRIA